MEKINNDLVRLTTQDVNGAKPIVNSRVVAEDFSKNHKNVVRKIEDLISSKASLLNSMFFENVYFDIRGRKQKEYLLNRDGFSLLVMGFSGKNALEFKLKYIEAFNFMEKELQVRKETRHIGINARKSLTDSIKLNIDENTNFKKFAYSNYSKLVYKKVLGKTVKKAKEEIGLTSKDNIRNHFSIGQLEEVQKIESKIATWIEAWKDLEMTDKEVYEKIKEKL